MRRPYTLYLSRGGVRRGGFLLEEGRGRKEMVKLEKGKGESIR